MTLDDVETRLYAVFAIEPSLAMRSARGFFIEILKGFASDLDPVQAKCLMLAQAGDLEKPSLAQRRLDLLEPLWEGIDRSSSNPKSEWLGRLCVAALALPSRFDGHFIDFTIMVAEGVPIPPKMLNDICRLRIAGYQ